MDKLEVFKHYVNMLVKNHINCFLCHSKAGYGKTFTTINFLKELNQEYIYVSGVTTPVELYKLFFDNNNKIIVLDDVETMFQDDKTIQLLKSALWSVTNQRQVSYKTTSKTLVNYPDTFEFTGKIIILANEIKGKKDESFKALISRCLKYKLTYTLQELKDLSIEIIEEKKDLTIKQKQLIAQIINEITPEYDYNLRLMDRLITFAKYDEVNAKMLFYNSVSVDEDKKILLQILNNNKSVEEQVKEYMNLTGHSRMTFFRKKKKLKV